MTRKSGTASDPRQLRADVEQAREQLAETVAELAGKADVKAQAREMAAHAKSKALFEMNDAKVRMQHTAQEATGRGFTKPGPAMAVVGGLGVAALTVYLVLQRRHGEGGAYEKLGKKLSEQQQQLGKLGKQGQLGGFGKSRQLGQLGRIGEMGRSSKCAKLGKSGMEALNKKIGKR